MEDYDKFVQHRLSQLRSGEEEDEEHRRPSSASSLIRFYGQPILPPLLSGNQREEMQRYRDGMQKAAVQRKLKDDARMAYVQTILHSVQLRKTPTLDELLQESEVITQSSCSHNTSVSGGSVSQSHFFVGTKDSLSSPPVRKGKDGVSLPPLTSTTYSAFFASNVTPQESYYERCLIDQLDSQQGSQPSSFNGASHQSLSSGYVTYENVENTATISGGIDSQIESHGFGPSRGVYGMGDFFLHNTSDTIAKMPDIISHPPIDGEELERSGLELSFCDNIIGVKDICRTSFQEDSGECEHLLAEKSESRQLDTMEHEDKIPFTTIPDPDRDGNSDRNEEMSEKSDSSDNPSQTVSVHHCTTTELHIQPDPREAETVDNQVDDVDSELSEEPYRLSLQALLKKSQEYRRRQRMLRNQAKNTQIQERTQEQSSARAEEQSLSDKENDEFPYKGTVTAEGKKTKERKGTFIPSVETSPKTSWEKEKTIESEFTGKKMNVKSENTCSTGDADTKELTSVEEETTLKNNKLNSSQEVITKPKQISAFIQQQPMSAGNSLVQDAFYLTTCSTTFYKGIGKYCTFPAPNFCRSPVHCRSKGGIEDGQVVDRAGTSEGKFVVSTSLNEDCKVEAVNLGHQNNHTTASPTVNLMVEGDVTSVLAKSSQHIDQLESNLSSLKVLISDLESTVKENLDNQDQTESSTQSELSFKGIKHSDQIKNDQQTQLGQSDCDYLEDKQRDDDISEYREWPRRFNNCKNTHEDPGPEPNVSDTDDVLLEVQGKGVETVNFSALRLVNNSVTEKGNGKWMTKEGQTDRYTQPDGCRKQQPPAKCIFSEAQRMRIPDVFRSVPSETAAPCDVAVLSDTSNHLVERRREVALEGHDSICSPSVNQSYDVDTPSGLWFLEGSGSDLGSQGHLIQEKHLTPESGGEGQGGVSKVKRRLLMHMTEETQERRSDTSGGPGSVVRPNSSTPRAAVRWHEGRGSQKDKQEQLKQAHAAQVRALQDEHRKQQEELLQALAVRYHLLQSVSFPCMSGSRLGDTLTFSTLSQPPSPLSQHYRPLLSAAVKGFLTRRLLRTERVAQLVRTIRDTQHFLQAFQQQSTGRGEFCSRQDHLLQDRVTLQLRAARYEVYDIFFSLTAKERMQLISWDRELARERELKRQSGNTGHPGGKSSLSAATQKSLERKRGMMIQKRAAERHQGVKTRTGQKAGLPAKKPLETKRGQFRANPQRVPKSTFSSRPR